MNLILFQSERTDERTLGEKNFGCKHPRTNGLVGAMQQILLLSVADCAASSGKTG